MNTQETAALERYRKRWVKECAARARSRRLVRKSLARRGLALAKRRGA